MDNPQDTFDWRVQRLGKFTGSCASVLVKDPRTKKARENGELSETAKTYILENICEEMTGTDYQFSSAATDHGNEYENEAISIYEIETGCKVGRVGFIVYDKAPDHAGCSPDGLIIDDNGMIEVKCPYKPVNHLKNYMLKTPDEFKKQNADYYWQIQFNLMVTRCDWCDFISWSDSFDPKYKLKVLRIPANPEDIDLLHERLERAIAEKELIIAEL